MTNDGWLMIVYGSSYYLDPAIAILPSYLGTVMTHCGMGTPTNQPVQWMAVKSTVLQDTKKMYSTERHSMVVPTTRGHLHLVPFLYDSLYTYIYISYKYGSTDHSLESVRSCHLFFRSPTINVNQPVKKLQQPASR
jgi:hypothetical protein